jgi:uncharacterized protein (TIGR02118 family)
VIKFVALYRMPDDTEAFDDAYFSTHLPLLAQTPGLERTEVARVTRTLLGEPAYYLLAEMYFANADVLRTALKSAEWAASGENLKSFGAMELATMFTAEVVMPPGLSVGL